jgi:hypothetical protein
MTLEAAAKWLVRSKDEPDIIMASPWMIENHPDLVEAWATHWVFPDGHVQPIRGRLELVRKQRRKRRGK